MYAVLCHTHIASTNILENISIFYFLYLLSRLYFDPNGASNNFKENAGLRHPLWQMFEAEDIHKMESPFIEELPIQQKIYVW